MSENRIEINNSLRDNREEQGRSFTTFDTGMRDVLGKHSKNQDEQSEKMIKKLDEKLVTLTTENNKKLDEMRQVVDEKLQASVEKRFNESFTKLTETLEKVHKGLGEMQNVNVSINDLNKLFSGVKTRGIMGEMGMAMIIEDIMPKDSYEKNVAVKDGSNERVEYVIKLPGETDGKPLLLPLDAKFPVSDFERLMRAYEAKDEDTDIKKEEKAFEDAIKKNARDIRDKYITENTTNFAVMFVPSESIYAEITRRYELFHSLKNEYKVIVLGPINLAAFIHSLSMGFKTLTMQKNTMEAWDLLRGVKSELDAFAEVLRKTKKNLEEATNNMSKAETRTRVMSRQLKDVQVKDLLSDTPQIDDASADEEVEE
jgi:DNA recombination protein RmuC